MLITFKSKAAADILMYEEHARPLLELLGKETARGIITAAETAQAIDTLQAAIEAERAREAELAAQQEAQEQDDDDFDAEERRRVAKKNVSFGARAYPLLEMLRAANAGGRDIVWGV